MIEKFLKEHEQLKEWNDDAIVSNKDSNEQYGISIKNLLEEYEEYKQNQAPEIIHDTQKIELEDPYYVFFRFDEDSPFGYMACPGNTCSLILERPTVQSKNEEISIIENHIHSINFTDPKGKTFKMYAVLKDQLTESEQKLLNND